MVRHWSHKIVYRLHRAIPIDFNCVICIAARSIDEAIALADSTFKKKHGGCIVMSTTTFEMTNEELAFALKGE